MPEHTYKDGVSPSIADRTKSLGEHVTFIDLDTFYLSIDTSCGFDPKDIVIEIVDRRSGDLAYSNYYKWKKGGSA